MSLSYRLYQIGRTTDDPGTSANITDSGETVQSSISTIETGSGDTYWDFDVSGDAPFPQIDAFYILIGDEVLNVFTDAGNDRFVVRSRGMFGTPVQSHAIGDTIYNISSPEETLQNDVVIHDEVEDFDVITLGQVEETIEREKGQFRISNVEATVRGIDRHRLSEAGSIQQPWVFEVYNSSDSLIFQGFVREDIRFNAETEKINFQAVSWLDILNKVEDIPARLIYETEVINDKRSYRGANIGTEVVLDITNEDFSTNNNVLKGDTAVIETGKGEIRQIISADSYIANRTGEGLRRIFLHPDDFFQNVLYDSRGANVETISQLSGTGLDSGTESGFNTKERYTWRTLSVAAQDGTRNQNAEDAIEEIGEKGGYSVLTFDSNNNPVQKFPVNAFNRDPVPGVFDPQFDWPSVFYEERVYEETPIEGLKTHDYYLITTDSAVSRIFEKYGAIDQGDNIKILGKEAWGYAGEETNNLPASYDPATLISALLSVNDEAAGEPLLGILPEIVAGTPVSYDASTSDSDLWEEIDPRIEFPTKPIEALRMIQQDSGLLLSENVSTQQNTSGADVPLVDFSLKSRDTLFENEISGKDVMSWNESVSKDNIRAVVVTTNNQYGGGEDIPTVKGWYYDSVEKDEEGQPSDSDYKPNYTTAPEGEGVIEIKTNVYPAHEGVVYSGRDEEIRRDERLSALVRKFYEHFTKANREVEFTVAQDDPDWLGEYVSFNEGPVIDDAVLITSKTSELKENHFETSLTGRIGRTTRDPDTEPKVVIKGTTVYDANENDEVEVRLTGVDSWDPGKGTLTYEWEYREVGNTTWISAGNAIQLNETFTGVTAQTQYEVRLTVTNTATSTSVSDTKIISVQPYRSISDETYSNEIEYDKTQNTQGGTRFGRVTITPKLNSTIETVEYKAEKGGEIDPSANWIEVGAGNDPAAVNSQVVTNGGITEGYYVEVELDTAHVSNIQIRTTFVQSSGFQPVVRPFAFDFDKVAEVSGFTAYANSSGEVFVDISVDEDTDEFDVDYSDDGGSRYTTFTTIDPAADQTELGPIPARRPLADGGSRRIRIVPRNDDTGQGEIATRVVNFNRNEGGATNFDSIEITNAGVLDGQTTSTFRFRDASNNDNATIDAFNLDVREIGGVDLSQYAILNQNETFTNGLNITGGNVGIGATSPAVKTVISGPRPRLAIVNENIGTAPSGMRLEMNEINNDLRVQTADADGSFGGNTVASFNINGNVGINTISPQETLHVAGTGVISADYGSVSTYSSGYGGSGFKLSETLNGKPDAMELSHLNLRGTLRVRELIASQIEVERGKRIISPGGGKVASIATSSHTSVSNTFTNTTQQEWTFENDGGNEMAHGLDVGDRLLAQRFDPSSQNVVAQIRAVVDEVPNNFTARVTVNTDFTTPNTGEEVEGYTFSVVGSSNTSRDSFLLDNPFGPFRDVFDGISNFNDWDNRTPNVRIGNLNGAYGYSSDVAGFAAGKASNEHVTVDPNNGVRILDGSGNVAAQLSGSVFNVGNLSYDASNDTLSVGNADITGTLEIGTNGQITNATGEFYLTEFGLDLEAINQAEGGNAIAFWDDPVNTNTRRGAIYASPNSMFLYNDNGSISFIIDGPVPKQLTLDRPNGEADFQSFNVIRFGGSQYNADENTWETTNTRTSDPPAPSTGYKTYYRSDTNEWRIIHSTGDVDVIATG